VAAQPEFRLHPELKVGPICLRTKSQDSMLSFYTEDLGLRKIGGEGAYTTLGSESSTEPLLILHHDRNASTPPPDATGLYHYALLVPDRKSLAIAYLTLGERGVVFDGYADHLVSEALYLTDPDRNGIEIYCDRPRSERKFDEGGIEMATQPLDPEVLIKELRPDETHEPRAIVDGTTIGHIHLKVSDLQTSVAFYQGALGFELRRYFGSAAFLSAGGYHHHVGMNTWESLGGPPSRDAWIGLEYVGLTVHRSDLDEIFSRLGENGTAQVTQGRLFVPDPDNINLLLRPS
jgi:catechol 2,3-dioxygenase